ncbi:ABC transporter permease [Skermanella aerolata]|uniref:ABC transporter permease n=2 Tax=Skermanella aerolata TaxID=393310 RepID=A0A512DIX9_9PROT|nr:ABC transporter permease [Skermanella aerolata]
MIWKGLIHAAAGLMVALPLISGDAAAQKRPTVCFVTFSLQVKYFQSSVAGGQRAADEVGADLVVLDPQADAGRQVTLVEDCIARGANAIVIDPIESGSLMGVIDEAGSRNIPIAVLDTPVNSPHVVTQIGVPQFEASREFGQFVAGYVIGKMGGKAKVGIMLASTEVQLARRDGFIEAMKSVPGVEIVATGDGRNILERATSEAEDMLTANPGIDVIYATGDPQLQGGLAAAASQGRNIAFFGWDDIPQPFLKPLEEGKIVGFLKQSPDIGGATAVKLLVQHLAGQKIPARFSYNPSVVTQYNLDKFR